MEMTREDILNILFLALAEHHSGNIAEAIAIVDAQLAALEAKGVRLVPVDPDDNQLAAGMESDSISHPWEALGVYKMMVSASPYNTKETK